MPRAAGFLCSVFALERLTPATSGVYLPKDAMVFLFNGLFDSTLILYIQRGPLGRHGPPVAPPVAPGACADSARAGNLQPRTALLINVSEKRKRRPLARESRAYLLTVDIAIHVINFPVDHSTLRHSDFSFVFNNVSVIKSYGMATH